MGLADRPYMTNKGNPHRVGGMSLWTMTTWLIVVNVVVFVVGSMFVRQTFVPGGTLPNGTPIISRQIEPVLTQWGQFSFDKTIRELQVWRFSFYTPASSICCST
jgi:hypothetical protein